MVGRFACCDDPGSSTSRGLLTAPAGCQLKGALSQIITISMNSQNIYHKILIIYPGLIFVHKAFLLGVFLVELIFRGACYQKEFWVSKWVWLVNKNS